MPKQAQVEAAGSALFYMPYISIPTLIAGQERYNETIREVVKRSGVLLLDVGDLIPGDARHFVDSRHFDAAGSQIMGAEVAQTLVSSDGFKRWVEGRSLGCHF